MRGITLAAALVAACAPADHVQPWNSPEGEPTAWDASHAYRTADGKFDLYFTAPGLVRDGGEDPQLDDALIEAIDGAADTIHASLYEFGRANIIDALIAANDRGVDIQFVGDGDELGDEGYEALEAAGIELVTRRPRDRIMHNKFLVIDSRWVWTGSTNISENGVMRNNNGSVLIDSPSLADRYEAEFVQMHGDVLFGRQKAASELGSELEVGDHGLVSTFSPKEDGSQQLLSVLAGADHTVYFFIFSFTRTDIAQELIRLHDSGVQVIGIFDVSQARGRYSVDEILALAGVPVFLDGNENKIGFSGGKLHHKTLLVDALTPSDPTVALGSYNWSNNATNYNDENLLVIDGPELPAAYFDEFCRILAIASPHPDYTGERPDPCSALITNLRINEFLPNPEGSDRGREYVEVLNTGFATVDLAGWTLGDRTRADRHTFAPFPLAPGEAVVVAAGSEFAADSTLPWEIASSGSLSLANNSDEIFLRSPDSEIVDHVAYTSAPSGVSFNRALDGAESGDFILHDAVADAAGLTSPGLQADGTVWGPQIVINELLANPTGTDLGSEWVELVNVGAASVPLGGWTISDGAAIRHVFAASDSIEPGQSIVVFDRGAHPAVPGHLISSTARLSLNNSGDSLTLQDGDGRVRDEVDWSGSTNGVSLVRELDGDSDAPLVDHDTVLGADGVSSPGRRVDGKAWGGELLINELLPNPAGSDSGAEWIEVVNVGSTEVALDGWSLGDAVNSARHVFDVGTTLSPGESLVVWDSGSHPGDLVASTGLLSLNNSGDLITLSDGTGGLISAVSYPTATEGVSFNRDPDGAPDGAMISHEDLAGTPSSAGTRADGTSW